MSANITIFDRALMRRRQQRIKAKFSAHDFLFTWSRDRLIDRLYDVTRDFDTCHAIGSRHPITAHNKITSASLSDMHLAPLTPNDVPYFCADDEFLPLKHSALDLITSNLHMHTINDLPGVLLQIRQSLKPDGLFLASMFGGETLRELREVMTEADLAHFGGTSPHISPFADKPQMGDLLQRAGFALPVVDSEIVTVTYDSIFKLFGDLRGMGESNVIHNRRKTPLTRGYIMDVARRYHDKFSEPDGRIVASFEVIFLLGWAPHSSQQKPLRRGSATNSLAERLGGTEIPLNDKAQP